jgi:ribosomal-protein-serine acetyltransferase
LLLGWLPAPRKDGGCMNSLSPETIIAVDDAVELRQVPIDDGSILFELTDRNREYLRKWLPWVDNTNSVDDSVEFLKGSHQRFTDGSDYGFGVYVNGDLAGHTGLKHLKNSDLDPEIGYWLGEEFAGQGITTRVARKLTELALLTLEKHKVIIRADVNNAASNRIAQKLDYHFERQSNDELRPGHILNVWAKTKN